MECDDTINIDYWVNILKISIQNGYVKLYIMEIDF
jgi:hypothetical protein